jgi:hypothetical protein
MGCARPDRDARLIAALLTSFILPLALFACVAGVVLHAQFVNHDDAIPPQMLLLSCGIVSLGLYVVCSVTLIISTELLALFGTPTVGRLLAGALLPGGLASGVVLDWAQPSRNDFPPWLVLLSALVPVLVWQVLLLAWWRLAEWLTRRRQSPADSR